MGGRWYKRKKAPVVPAAWIKGALLWEIFFLDRILMLLLFTRIINMSRHLRKNRSIWICFRVWWSFYKDVLLKGKVHFRGRKSFFPIRFYKCSFLRAFLFSIKMSSGSLAGTYVLWNMWKWLSCYFIQFYFNHFS